MKKKDSGDDEEDHRNGRDGQPPHYATPHYVILVGAGVRKCSGAGVQGCRGAKCPVRGAAPCTAAPQHFRTSVPREDLNRRARGCRAIGGLILLARPPLAAGVPHHITPAGERG